MKSNPTLIEFNHKTALHDALCQRIVHTLQQSIQTQGHATLALSGGNTPKPLFHQLASTKLPWEHVTITLVDERWVAPDSEASNEHLIRSILLQNYAASAQFIGLKTEDRTASEGIDACEARLTQLHRPFDLVLLGMGTDGHTASFFPHTKTLKRVLEGDRLCGAVTPLDAPHERMTLTLPFLLDTQTLILHIEGTEKYQTLQEALQGDDTAHMPVRALFQQTQSPLEVYLTQE